MTTSMLVGRLMSRRSRRLVSSRLLLIAFLLWGFGGAAAADDSKEAAIEKDRQKIAGTWRIVSIELNGAKINPQDVSKFRVVNGTDGTWSLRQDDKEISGGTSTFDPEQNPKAIDFTPTTGNDKGKVFLGIYELGENTRKLCFAQAGKERPTEFASTPGTQQTLVTFARVEED